MEPIPWPSPSWAVFCALFSGPRLTNRWVKTNSAFAVPISSVPFDEDYRPADKTRLTTHFANLAHGDCRRENLRNTLAMIDSRFNSLMRWDDPAGTDMGSVPTQPLA